MSDDGKIDFTVPGLDITQALDRRVARKLLKADVEGYERQIASIMSQVRTLLAQADALESYKETSEKKLARLGDDDDDE